MGLYEFIKSIKPAELAEIRGKRQNDSTRDKKNLLKRVKEIEEILEVYGKRIKVLNKGKQD